MRFGSSLFLLCAVCALAACGQSGSAASAPAATDQAVALSPELQAVYDRSCKTCHSLPASGAPQSGDRAAWAPRLAQGEDVLLDHTINGFNAMPPLGACMDCDEAQFRALVAYLSSGKAGANGKASP